jgi:hypothetical protein
MNQHIDIFSQYHLVFLRKNLCAKMKIVKVNGVLVESREGIVCVDAIGGGGLKIITHLKLPVGPQVEYEFEFTLATRRLVLPALLIRKEEYKNGLIEYDACFLCDEGTRTFIIGVANRLEVRRQYDQALRDCSLCFKSSRYECPTHALRKVKKEK